MRNFKKIIAITLAIIMLLSCVACGKSGGDDRGVKRYVENVYRVVKHELPANMQYISTMEKIPGGYLLYGDMQTEERGYYSAFLKVNENFELIEEIDATVEFEEEGDYYLNNAVSAPDGTMWTVVNWNFYDEKTTYWESKNYLTHLDADFKVIDKIETNKLLGIESGDEYEYSVYLNNFTIDDNGYICAIADSTFVCIDSNFEVIFSKTAEDIGASWFNNMMKTPKGLMLTYYDSSSNMKGVIFDSNTRTFSDAYDLGQNGYGQYYQGGGEYDFYSITSNSLLGYKLETGENEEVMNFLNSDLMDFYPNYMISRDDGSFLCTMWDQESEEGEMIIAELIPVPDSEVKPKYVLTIAGLYLNYQIKREVFNFNKTNEEYRIVIKDYSENIDYSENSEYTYEDAIAKLNGDIAAGNVPDILICNQEIPFDSYASKGLFENLYKYMENDEATKPEMFEENILKAYETGGKLYRISPSFSIVTIAAKPEMLGDAFKNWNMESFMKLADSLPEDVSMFQDITRDEMLNIFVRYMYDDFVNEDTGMCSFDDGRFEMILEFVNRLSTKSIWEDINYDELPPNFWEERENAFANNKVVLSQTYLSGFYDITSLVNYTFKTLDFEFVGFPTEGGSAAIEEDASSLAISSKSKLKDGAWEFIKSLLSEEYQENLGYNFPIRTSSLEKAMEKALKDAEEEKKRYEDMNQGGIDDGFGVVMPRIMVATEVATEAAVAVIGDETEEIIVEESTNGVIDFVEDETIEYETKLDYFFLDEALANKVLDCVRSARILVRRNEEVFKIINEEATRFLDGQCSAKEAAAQIQSRAFIYISENS